jgi:hypothetical protein
MTPQPTTTQPRPAAAASGSPPGAAAPWTGNDLRLALTGSYPQA